MMRAGFKKKKDLKAHEVLLKELAKVKTPVKSQRKANKKQDALDIKDFVSKSKPKDQVTKLYELKEHLWSYHDCIGEEGNYDD